MMVSGRRRTPNFGSRRQGYLSAFLELICIYSLLLLDPVSSLVPPSQPLLVKQQQQQQQKNNNVFSSFPLENKRPARTDSNRQQQRLQQTPFTFSRYPFSFTALQSTTLSSQQTLVMPESEDGSSRHISSSSAGAATTSISVRRPSSSRQASSSSSSSTYGYHHRNSNHIHHPIHSTSASAAASAASTAKAFRKKQIRKLFQQAKLLERKGQWRKACHILREILAIDPRDAHSHLALALLEARRHSSVPLPSSSMSSSSGSNDYFPSSTCATSSSSSQSSSWKQTFDQHRQKQHFIVRQAFQNGTMACPNSIHIWQAWAKYEDTIGATDTARELFESALRLDPYNPYVCHAYGMLEKKNNNLTAAMNLWTTALQKGVSTAALVCSLGEALVATGELEPARELYQQHLQKVKTPRETIEIYLAAAWLEERYFNDFEKAHALITAAVACSVVNDTNEEEDGRRSGGTAASKIPAKTSSLAQVALARLEGRRRQVQQGETIHKATIRRLASACIGNEALSAASAASAAAASTTETEHLDLNAGLQNHNQQTQQQQQEQHSDGRVYNAWARMEVKARRLPAARKILKRGLSQFPWDHSLLQAAGKVEERMGNYTAARDYYSASLRIQPSAPTLVSYALLDLRHPETTSPSTTTSTTTEKEPKQQPDMAKISRLFEEALLLDPRHGPAYNAYARTLIGQNNIDGARTVLERGLLANCPDTASIYHGYARLELSLGNVERARELLLEGQRAARRQDIGKDSPHRERAIFLTHTLGMLELNRNHPVDALNVFEDGIEMYGNSSQLLLGSALCEMKLGSEEKARKLFELAVLNDEKHAHAWQAWGVMEMRAGNVKTARTLFEAGIKSSPRHGALWQAYGTMMSRMGDVDEARRLFRAGIGKASTHIPLYQSWASMELREGNFTTAKALITEALTRNKRNGAGWLIAAEIEERLGNSGLHMLLLRRGIECSPDSPELYRALGEALVHKGKWNEAREIFEKGIEIDPMHAPLYHTLAELEARVGNVEGLSKLHKQATALFTANVMEPTPSQSDALGSKIKANRSRSVPRGVALLAERIVEEELPADDLVGESEDERITFLDKINSNLMENGLVGRLLSFEEQEASDEHHS